MNWDLHLITAKEETTYGTDSAPTGDANAILAQNVKLTRMAATEVERAHARPYQGARPSQLVGKHMKITFEVEAKGSGTAGTAPGCGVLLRSCKTSEVIVASTSVTYAPVSTNHKSRSIYFYIDGLLLKLVGCRGDWKYKLNADGIFVIEFSFTGLFTQPTDTALPTPTYCAQGPPRHRDHGRCGHFACGRRRMVVGDRRLDGHRRADLFRHRPGQHPGQHLADLYSRRGHRHPGQRRRHRHGAGAQPVDQPGGAQLDRGGGRFPRRVRCALCLRQRR